MLVSFKMDGVASLCDSNSSKVITILDKPDIISTLLLLIV